MAFDPGLRESGANASRQPYPDGSAGIRLSLEEMSRRIREGRLDPAVRGWAIGVLKDAGIDGRGRTTSRSQVGALLDALRRQTSYAGDPVAAEYISSAAATLCLRPGLCINGGDCDDLSVALGSAIMSIGIPAVIVKQSFGRDAQEHVLIAAQDESGNWIYADPSTRLPVGSAAQASEEVWVDPLSPIGQLPEVQAELVSLGKPRQLRTIAGRWFEERHDRLWVHDANTGWHDTGLSGFPQRVGTATNIFGYPTVSDLKDLLNAAAYFLQQLQAAAAACAGWADATAWATWQSDLTQVQSHFDDAVTLGNEIINKTPAWLMNVRVASGVDGGFAWERVREVIRDITDLDRRFRQAGGCLAPNYPDTPQPTTPDTQLEAYKTADALAKGAEQLGNKIKDPTTIAIGGVVVGIAVAIGAAIVIDRLLPRR